MKRVNGKKAKWIGCIDYEDGISITQHIFTRDVVKFAHGQSNNFSTSVNKIHTYVFPYVLNEARKQDYNISSISIKEVEVEQT